LKKFLVIFFILSAIAGVYSYKWFSQSNSAMPIAVNPPIKKIASNNPIDSGVGDRAIQKLEKKYGDLLYESTDDYDSTLNSDSDRVSEVVSFGVTNDVLKKLKASKRAAFQEIVDDPQFHKQLWHRFSSIIPLENRKMISEFKIMTDGKDGTLGYVQQKGDLSDWTLALDFKDASNLNGLYATIIHEYGHLFSLNAYEFDENAKCSNYNPGQSCLKKDAYLNEFYDRFWKTSLYNEWKSVDDIETDQDAQSAFFLEHSDEFLTEYSTSHPTEDFAEAWMYFILSEKPVRYNVADDKILFFYKYPELVQLRNVILTNLLKNYK